MKRQAFEIVNMTPGGEKKKTKQQGERVLVLDFGRERERIYAGFIAVNFLDYIEIL
jgi:hypothetical protein